MGEGKAIPLQFGKVLQVFAIVLVPVCISMLLRAKRTAFAAVGLAALTFNLVSMGVGYGVPKLARMPEPPAIAIGTLAADIEQPDDVDPARDLKPHHVLYRGRLRLARESPDAP